MRAFRWVMVATVIGAVLVIPTEAAADGGAFIQFDKTHFLPGETATGEAYVYLKGKQQGLLQRGPFYAVLLTNGATIHQGQAIPDGAVRLGAFSIEPYTSKDWFEMRVSFTVPDLPGDFYPVGVCNDPCTTPGFREPLSGLISVVQTVREGRLLTEQQRLQGQIYGLHHDVKKAEKQLGELQTQLTESVRVNSDMSSEVSRVKAQLAAATTAADAKQSSRPLIPSGAGVAIAVALLILAGAVGIRRRRQRAAVTLDRIDDAQHKIEEPANR